jgi:hypothetical protein
MVFQIYVADFPFRGVNAKRQTAIAGNAEAPRALSVAGQDVCLPHRERAGIAEKQTLKAPTIVSDDEGHK